MKYNYLVVGSTGLVGSNLIKFLSNLGLKTIALTRRKISNLPANVDELLIDFNHSLENISLPQIEHVCICLGTTIKIAGSKEEFKKVDVDYCVKIAEKVKKNGTTQISLVSSVGADENSKNFYLKMKGILIKKIIGMGFETINIYQPGLLIGKREKKRFLENIGQRLAFLIDPLLVGKMSKYRSIKAESIALHMTNSKTKGINYFHYKEIMDGL